MKGVCQNPKRFGRLGLQRLAVRASLVLLAPIALSACGQEGVPEQPRPVETVAVGPAEGSTSTAYSGQVLSRYTGNYGFRVAGMITERLVDVGQTVSAGQILARLDPHDLSVGVNSAQAQTAAAGAQASAQTTDLIRAKRLLDEGFISPAEYDRQRAAAQSANAQLSAARAQLRGADQQLSYSILRATRAGVVTAVSGEPGEVVPAGQPVVVVASPGTLEVALSVPEGEVATFRSAQLGVRLWVQPGKVFPATIRTLSAAANPQTRTFDARVAFEAPAGTASIGNTAEVVVRKPVDSQHLRVPLSAITQWQGKSVVWIVSANPARVSPRVVAVSAVQNNDALIAARLLVGSRIVSAGAHLLKPGELVRAMPSSASTDR